MTTGCGTTKELTDSPCINCGACAIVCPTGALMKADSSFGRIAQWAVPSTCAFCGVGCGLLSNLKNGKLVSTSPDLEDKTSSRYLCVRSQFGDDFAMGAPKYPDATEPLIIADGGGSNGSHSRLRLSELKDLSRHDS